MDMSLVSAAMATQAGNTQMQIAATIMKKNADAEKSAVLTLLGESNRRRPISPPASAAIWIFRSEVTLVPARCGALQAASQNRDRTRRRRS